LNNALFSAMSVIFYLILYLVMAGLWLGYYYLIKCLYIPNPADGGPPLYSYNTGWAPSYFGTIGSEPSKPDYRFEHHLLTVDSTHRLLQTNFLHGQRIWNLKKKIGIYLR
jgi:hypothetical protein